MESKSYGRPQVGGPFTLITQDNTLFTEKELLGKWTLIYFGFTNCPDICPEELDKMSEAVTILGMHRYSLYMPSKLTTSRINRERTRVYNPTSVHLRRPPSRHTRPGENLPCGFPSSFGRPHRGVPSRQVGLQSIPGLLLYTCHSKARRRLSRGSFHILLFHGSRGPIRRRVWEGNKGRRGRKTRSQRNWGVATTGKVEELTVSIRRFAFELL